MPFKLRIRSMECCASCGLVHDLWKAEIYIYCNLYSNQKSSFILSPQRVHVNNICHCRCCTVCLKLFGPAQSRLCIIIVTPAPEQSWTHAQCPAPRWSSSFMIITQSSHKLGINCVSSEPVRSFQRFSDYPIISPYFSSAVLRCSCALETGWSTGHRASKATKAKSACVP